MTLHSQFRARQGFTLIELLLVIGIIAILASIVIVAINPSKQLGEHNDAQRRGDVNTLINAVYQYAVDNDSVLPGCLADATLDTTYNICQSAGCGDTTNPCDLDTDLKGDYLSSIPADPSAATTNDTGYDIVKQTGGRIKISAPSAEEATTIEVTR